MFSYNFKQSLQILGIFFICFFIGRVLYYQGILSGNLTIRLILGTTIALVLLSIYVKYLNIKQKRFSVSKDCIKYKMYSYVVILFCSILWSFLATLLDAGFMEYTVDIVLLSPCILLVLYFYTIWVDSQIENPYDEYYKFGYALVEGNFKQIWFQKEFLRMILLKSQFLPFMYIINLLGIGEVLYTKNIFALHEIFATLLAFGVMFDVLIGLFGYIFTSKILNNKVRSIDTHCSGWLFCLICYPPFYYIFKLIYPVFEHPIPADWFIDANISRIATIILLWVQAACWVIYWWSTLEFGLKFSNLTWRGLIDTGPYKYCKHPAYLSKNLFWWLSLLPYLCTIPIEQKIKLASGLLVVNFVYFCRAKCEERHLKQFPEYQDYCQKF